MPTPPYRPHMPAMTRFQQPVFVEKRIRYKGERIAAVAAVDEETAVEALEKISLDIEEETPVFDPLEAIKPGAPLVRPQGNVWKFPAGGKIKFRLGDVEKGFAEADFIVEDRYVTNPNLHAAMEPRVSVAYVDEANRLIIHSVSQQLALLLKNLAPVFNLPMSKINIIGGTVGGGFGGKNHIHTDHVAGLMALKTGKPVKYRLTRQEDLSYTSLRGGWIYMIKDGIKKDGRLVARQINEFYDMGAYSDFSPSIMEKIGSTCGGPYWIPNVSLDGYAIYTNKPPASSMRGFHLINLTFALEMQMNRIAETIGMDPWELRFINAWRNGDLSPSQWVVESAGMIEALKKTAELGGIELPDRLKAMSSERR